LESSVKTVCIIALSPSNSNHIPPTELDGVHGLLHLCKVLATLGLKCVILTDSVNTRVIHQLLTNFSGTCNFYNNKEEENSIIFPQPVNDNKIQLRGFIPTSAWDEKWEASLRSIYSSCDYILSLKHLGKSSESNHYYLPHGATADEYVAPFELIFDWAAVDKKKNLSHRMLWQ